MNLLIAQAEDIHSIENALETILYDRPGLEALQPFKQATRARVGGVTDSYGSTSPTDDKSALQVGRVRVDNMKPSRVFPTRDNNRLTVVSSPARRQRRLSLI